MNRFLLLGSSSRADEKQEQNSWSSDIRREAEAIPPAIENVIADVQTSLQQVAKREMRECFRAAVTHGDSRMPIQRLMQEVERVTAEVRNRILGAKTRIQALLHEEIRRVVVSSINSPERPHLVEKPRDLAAEVLKQTIAQVDAALPEASAPKASKAPEVSGQIQTNAGGKPELSILPEVQMYSGTVRLSVKAKGRDPRSALHFLAQLRRKPQFRLLRVLGDTSGDMEIVVGLREPLELKENLMGMQEVNTVKDLSGPGSTTGETQLQILLA